MVVPDRHISGFDSQDQEGIKLHRDSVFTGLEGPRQVGSRNRTPFCDQWALKNRENDLWEQLREAWSWRKEEFKLQREELEMSRTVWKPAPRGGGITHTEPLMRLVMLMMAEETREKIFQRVLTNFKIADSSGQARLSVSPFPWIYHHIYITYCCLGPGQQVMTNTSLLHLPWLHTSNLFFLWDAITEFLPHKDRFSIIFKQEIVHWGVKMNIQRYHSVQQQKTLSSRWVGRLLGCVCVRRRWSWKFAAEKCHRQWNVESPSLWDKEF